MVHLGRCERGDSLCGGGRIPGGDGSAAQCSSGLCGDLRQHRHPGRSDQPL